jgi:hypothetical protein
MWVCRVGRGVCACTRTRRWKGHIEWGSIVDPNNIIYRQPNIYTHPPARNISTSCTYTHTGSQHPNTIMKETHNPPHPLRTVPL